MDKIDLKHIKKKIREILLHSGYTQQEWAEMLEISQPSISHYLKGRIPPVEVLTKIAELVQIPLESILFPVTYESENNTQILAERKGEYLQQEIVVLFNKLPIKMQKQLLSFLRTTVAELEVNS